MAKKPDFYATLGVTRDASQEEIKRAYFEAAQRLHPDKNKVSGETELFLEIQQAFETLSNPKRRGNYDATLPPEEKQSLPIGVEILYSRQNLVHLDKAQLLYVLLEVKPKKKSDELPAPPLNVCLVLDLSTSMKGEKLDMLKSGAIQVLRGLRQQDVFSIVTFSDRARVLIPASYRPEKSMLEARIQLLQASGGTEIYQGLEAGYNEILRNSDPSRINHIILLTDGQTYGDEANCLELAGRAGTEGIGISAMGIGKEWNDIFLDTLASKTGGSSKYIARPQDIQKFLVEKFEALARIFSDDVVLNFQSTPGAELVFAFRTQPEPGPLPLESPVHLGPILNDSNLAVLFEYRVDSSLAKKKSIQLLTGTLKPTFASLPTPVQPIRLEFSRPIKTEAGEEPPPAKIVKSLGKLTLYRMQEKARKEVETGQFELAAQHLKQLATNLLAQGEQSLARTALIEAENLQKMQNYSEEGRRAIKYGTRSLLAAIEKEQQV